MTLAIPPEHNEARLRASRDLADTGAQNARLRIYDADDVLLVTMTLAKPCGTVAANKLVLVQQDPSGDQITTQGSAAKGVWITGAGNVHAVGTVTDEAGDGDFKVSGTTGTMLYAGARAILGQTELS
ncbi:hypothetical protein [Acidovorax phage ACPWH]|nr:hypothetical protein [Acidovorax phage ACPWH]QXV72262.1 hypothetical protein Acf1_00065 [Acidovorax phage ACF1]